ncbi:MAG: hybrid sensor histidine kinase/response regulator [Rickettsiaceae bacterium]|nr:hybrid sensor histidine kinase/response regulator [Rickettsiaceae bacterium]
MKRLILEIWYYLNYLQELVLWLKKYGFYLNKASISLRKVLFKYIFLVILLVIASSLLIWSCYYQVFFDDLRAKNNMIADFTKMRIQQRGSLEHISSEHLQKILLDLFCDDLEQVHPPSKHEFILINSNYEFISSSSLLHEDYNRYINNHQVPKLLENQGLLSTDIKINNIIFSTFFKIPERQVTVLIGQKDDFFYKNYYNLIIKPLIAILLPELVLVLTMYVIISKIIGPISELSDLIKNISNGTLDQRVKDYQVKELDLLASHIKQIQIYAHEITSKNRGLKKALDEKIDFLSNISHEIKTPITGFAVLSSGLRDRWDAFSDKQKFGYLKDITKSADRLKNLIVNLLDISKFDAGKIILSFSTFDFVELVEEMIDECKSLYMKNNDIKIKFSKNHKLSFLVYADKEKISQVLRNLFFNAIKYSENEGVIHVSVERTQSNNDHYILFSIKDQGVGIPNDEVSTIFEPFKQSSRTKDKTDGTGLGLAISKGIIEMHRGKIWAKNNKDLDNSFQDGLHFSRGACFYFTIPYNSYKTSKPKGQAKTERESVFDLEFLTKANNRFLIRKNDVNGKTQNNNKKIAGTDKNAQERELEEILSPKNILIIDDEQICFRALEIILSANESFNLTHAFSAEEAIELIKNTSVEYDLILLDMMMPAMSGMDMLSLIKNSNDERMKKIPIIIQSGISQKEDIKKALKEGAVGYIAKPYETAKVFASVLKIINY